MPFNSHLHFLITQAWAEQTGEIQGKATIMVELTFLWSFRKTVA